MKKIILSAAFLAIGTFAMAQQNMDKMQTRDPAKMEQKRADNMKQMQSDLSLSDTQVTQINALHEKKMAERKANEPKMQAERKAKMQSMKSNKDQWNSEMKAILTPDQYQKWEAKKAEKMQNRKVKMQEKKMDKMSTRS